jgi:hypothetical protein
MGRKITPLPPGAGQGYGWHQSLASRKSTDLGVSPDGEGGRAADWRLVPTLRQCPRAVMTAGKRNARDYTKNQRLSEMTEVVGGLRRHG